MKEILREIEVLEEKILKTSQLDKIDFAKVIYAITNKLTRSELFNMSNEELKKHIQKIQKHLYRISKFYR